MKIETKDISTIYIDYNGFKEKDKNLLVELLNKGLKPDYVYFQLSFNLTDEQKLDIISELYNILAKYNKQDCSYDIIDSNNPNFIEKLRAKTGYFYSFEGGNRYVSKDEYDNADKIIETYVNMIKIIIPTPLEAIFYAAYIIGGYEYKENNSDRMKARTIATVATNEQIVCVGFSKLYVEVLKRLGIKSTGLCCSYKKEKIEDYHWSDHETPVVLVNDDTYNIHDSIYTVDIVALANHMKFIKSLMQMEYISEAVEREMHFTLNKLKESTFLSINQKEHNIQFFGINIDLATTYSLKQDSEDNLKSLMEIIPNASKDTIIQKFNNAPILNWQLSKAIWENLEHKIGYPLFDISNICEKKRQK